MSVVVVPSRRTWFEVGDSMARSIRHGFGGAAVATSQDIQVLSYGDGAESLLRIDIQDSSQIKAFQFSTLVVSLF